MKCPDPGIYFDVPSADYFAWDAVSNSRLSLMARSPMHYKHGYGEPTPAMRLGSLIHSGVLEPLSIAKRYVFMPDYSSHPHNVTANGERSFSSATKFVKSMQEQFTKLNHDKEIVSEGDFNTLLGIAASLTANTVTRELLRDGVAEASVVWIDEETGLLCKARVDWLKHKDGKFCDLKTTVDASDFERSLYRYGYHRQMAFYRRGLLANGIDSEPWIMAVEKSAPFGCRAAPMDSAAVAVGNDDLDVLLNRVVECEQSGQWPGYANPESWALPDWADRGQVELVIGGETLSV